MKKTLILLGMLALTPLAKGQLLLEALEGEIPFTPSPRCLERVKDKHYGDGLHNFIYCAVMGPNGKKWLNLNLGAEYAREASPDFNPEVFVTSADDTKAFGSQFLWGRPANGHELVESYELAPDGLYYQINRKLVDESNAEEWWNKDKQVIDRNLNNIWGNNDADPCPEGYKVASEDDLWKFVDGGSVDLNRSFRQTQIVHRGALSLMFAPTGKFYKESYTWQHNNRNIPNFNAGYAEQGTSMLWGVSSSGHTYWFVEISGLDWGAWREDGSLRYWWGVHGDSAANHIFTGAIRCVEK